MCVMRTVGMRELRQNLSVYLRALQEDGEPFEVTDRGRPVAILAPIGPAEDEFEALIASGRLRPAEAGWSSFVPPAGPIGTAGTDALAEQRADRL